jgi:Uma2 family endonuclease
MTQARTRFSTFDEYFEWSNEHPDNICYELIDGELIELPPESGFNDLIANYLFLKLVQAGVPFQLVRPGKCEVQVRILQPKDAQNRYPDLVVLRDEHLALTQTRLTIKLDMPPPRLAVEVVSPSSGDRDYVRKRAQYANIGVLEYWIIDPGSRIVTVLELSGTTYATVGVFSSDDRIISPIFPELQLTPEEIFVAAA